MYKCEICGREIKYSLHITGKQVCLKHYHQFKKHGCFLDNIPRTNSDLNDFSIVNDVAIFNLYNQKNIKVAEFKIDAEDIRKVQYKKWRMNAWGYVVSGNNTKTRPTIFLHRLICNNPDCKFMVDHINHNTLDNRKCNLRVCSQSENMSNSSISKRSSSGFCGVFFDKQRRKWAPEISKQGVGKKHLGRYTTIEEAVLARLCAERILYQEFKNDIEYKENIKVIKNIPFGRKREIYKYIIGKLC